MNDKSIIQLGKYELLQLLGSGATADVYRARDITLNREVALKVLKPSLVVDAAAFERFIHEARSAAGLFHPNIATVLDMGEAEGRYFIAMRFYPGQSLDKILKENSPLSWEDTLKMADQIGSALDYAHGQGFLHRDVKPSNILRTPEGDFILTDFGLTRAMMSTGLTSHTGAVLGTPSYIAPEIWEGRHATPATDQYALACVIYEALTGQVLFAGETPPVIMTRHVLKGAELPERWLEGTPPHAKLALAKSLEKDANQRYPRAGDLTQALTSAVSAHQMETPPSITIQPVEPRPQQPPISPIAEMTFQASPQIMQPVNDKLLAEIPERTVSPTLPHPNIQTETGSSASKGSTWKIAWIVFGLIALVILGVIMVGGRATPVATITRIVEVVRTVEVVVEVVKEAAPVIVTATPIPTQPKPTKPVPTVAPRLDPVFSTATAFVSGMRVIFSDNFNRPDEILGDDENFLHRIKDDVEVYEYKKSDCTGWWFWLDEHKTPDKFSLATDLRIASGGSEAEISLLFRSSETGSYQFTIRKDDFRLVRWEGDQPWVNLFDWTYSPLIKPGEWSKVVINGDGPLFRIFINDSLLVEIEDNTLTTGHSSLHMYACQPGQTTIFELDNFKLLNR